MAMTIPAARAMYAPAVFNKSVAECPTDDSELSHLFSPSAGDRVAIFVVFLTPVWLKYWKQSTLDQFWR